MFELKVSAEKLQQIIGIKFLPEITVKLTNAKTNWFSIEQRERNFFEDLYDFFGNIFFSYLEK